MPDLPFDATHDGTQLRLAGDIEEYSIERLRELLVTTLAKNQELTIDLTNVGFMPSVAVNELVAALNMPARNVTLVARAGSPVADTLNYLGIRFTEVEPGEQDAD